MLTGLERLLAAAYKSTPKLSLEAQKSIVDIWPWVALVFGALQLWAALALWHWGHTVNRLVDSLNSYYGSASGYLHHLNLFYWLSLAVLIAEGLILLLAFPKLRTKAKSGWRLLFYGALLNLVYGVLSALNDYGSASSLVVQIIVSAAVLYFLFQIREHYSSHK